MRRPNATTALLLVIAGLLAVVAHLARTVRELRASEHPSETADHAVIRPPEPARVVTVIQTNGFHWAEIESEDYRAYIQGLRAIGCPEQTIRDIIVADVDRLLAPQLQSLIPRRAGLKYWHPEEQELWHNFDHRNWLDQQQELDHEKREIVRELLGIDLVGERMYLLGQEDYYGRRLGFLPDEKRSQVRMIIERYASQELALREKEWDEGQPLSAEDGARLREIREARQRDLASLLTPGEMRQYELWLSPTANTVRNSLFGMDASEQEFLAIYQVRHQFDQQWGVEGLDLSQPVARKIWEEAQKQLEEQIRGALGDKRYFDYVIANDPDYRQALATAARYNLPAGTARELYDFKASVLAQRHEIVNTYLLTADERDAALQVIAAEAERSVLEKLGDRAFNHYRHHGQGGWIYH